MQSFIINKSFPHSFAALLQSCKWLPVLFLLAYSLSGGLAFSQEMSISPGYQKISLPAEFLAKGMFLVAGRHMKDPRFSESVILIAQCDQKGVQGIIINQPTDTKLSEILPRERLLWQRKDLVYYGGPVGRMQIILLIHSDVQPEDAIRVFDGVYASGSISALNTLIESADPQKEFRAYAGYAGWLPGQLEREIARGDWHIMHPDAALVFHKNPQSVWPDLISRAANIWTKNMVPGALRYAAENPIE